MSEYIIIKDLHADDVNFEQNFSIIANFPAITSFLGFVHAAFRKINGLSDISVCPILHGTEMYNGIERHIPTIENIKKNQGASLYPFKKGSVDFSLIIEIDIDSTKYKKDNIINDIYDIFLGSTLSGGVVKFNHIKNNSIIYVMDSEKDFYENVSTIRSGKIISDSTELLFKEGSNEDKMDELLDIIEIKKDEEGNILPNKYEGFLIPIAIGYAALEEIKKREGRNGLSDHCYVESVIGLGEVLHFSKNRIQKIFAKKVFWYYTDPRPDNKHECNFLCAGMQKI